MPVAKPENYQAVKAYYEINPKATLNEIAKATGVPIRSVRRYVKELKTATVRNNQTVQQRTLDTAQRIANERKAIYTMSPKSDESAREAIIKPFCANTGRKYRLTVVLFDLHIPGVHGIYTRPAQAAMKFIQDQRPDEIVLGGDFLDLACISHWNKSAPGKIINSNLGRDFQCGNMALYTLQSMTDKVTYLIGNHEEWLQQAMDSDIGLRGHLDIHYALRLYDRKIRTIPENGVYQIGEASIIHGWYTGIYHARKTVDAAMTNVFYGHTHDIQAYSKIKRPGHKPIIAQSCGCLCEQNPVFLRNKPNRWACGFLILNTMDDGTFSYYVPIIVGDRFVYGGKEYRA